MAKQLNLSTIPVRQTQPRVLPTTLPSGGDVTAVAADVSDLDTRTTAAEGDITSLDTRVGANETDIAALQAFAALFDNFADYADDTAAAAGGVAVGEFYHTSGAVKVRVS